MFTLLKGVRIIDLTTVVLGPYATQILADMGADVVKVESQEGDVFRAVRPGRQADTGVAFMNYNRNKRAVCIDLKSDEGQSVLHRLVADADIVVHNMRLRSANQLGADYETLSAIKPDLIYCFSAGYGQDGPDRDAPAYDDIIQARSGLAALNADANGAPQFVRTIACDKVVGLHLAIAMTSALAAREKTGEGASIEVPMLETMASFLLSEHLHGHTLVPPEGNLGYDRLMTRNRKPFATKDGYLAILPYSTKHWIRFFKLCDMPEWAEDERVTDAALRSENIDMLYGKIAAVATTRTTDRWITGLAEADIPCSVVNSLAALLDDPHLSATGMYHTLTDARLGKVQEVRSPFVINGNLDRDGAPNRMAPGLGADTDEVLESSGYSALEISDLRQRTIVS